MQTYAEVVSIAIPIFIVLVLIEYAISRWKHEEVIRSFDTISSLSSGMTNVVKDVLGLAVIIVSYDWMGSHLAIFDIKSTWLLYILTFVGLDFAGYWSHRFEHQINILWNRHIIHHSSEEFNLACALRQNISAIVSIFFFLYIPMAIIGIPAKIVAVVAPLHLFAQFWYHTRLIDKMGFLETVIVTPSHHRVHHAINDIYLDKNFGQIFIFWDKWFGTFQEELPDEEPVYGVKRPVHTWNPILINFQHLWLLLSDAWHTEKWIDKLKVFYMPTGWRPEDRLINDPIFSISDAHSQQKYETKSSLTFHLWAWLMLIVNLLFIEHLFSVLDEYSFTYLLLYALFIFASIFSITSLMDGSKLSLVGEVFKVAIATFIFYSMGGWFGIGELMVKGDYLFILFLFGSIVISGYYMYRQPIDRNSSYLPAK